MNKRDALRLEKGHLLLFCHSRWSEECDREQSHQVGIVEHVTKNGGIRVSRVRPYEDRFHDCGDPDHVEWVLYSHAYRHSVGEPEHCEEERAKVLTWMGGGQ